jgi:hypothetical protein
MYVCYVFLTATGSNDLYWLDIEFEEVASTLRDEACRIARRREKRVAV